MYKWYTHIALVFLMLFTETALGQEHDTGTNLEAIMESIIENSDEDTDAALIVEDLEELAETGLNINSVTENELLRLHLLNDIQIQHLLNYIRESGPVYSIYELNTIDGFSPDLLLQLLPFIRFGPADSEKIPESLKYGSHQVMMRMQGTLQKPLGFLEKEDGTTPYEGNRTRIYSRYRFDAGDRMSAGLTAEKDPGEAFFSGSNRQGFDFYSGHVSFGFNSLLEKITVGDFIVRSGQGLVLWQGYSMGKSLNTLNISKTGQGSRPYTSTDENHYFRGVSTSLKYKNGRVILFYSRKGEDANLAFTDSAGSFFTSLQTSGYHRTQNEIEDEKSIRHINLGSVATWHFRTLKIGATVLMEKFEFPFIRSDQLYNRYRFSGMENLNFSADYLYTRGKYQWFGEAARARSGGMAFLQGMVAHLHDRIGFTALLRNFNRDYQATWASAFSEGSAVTNETGFYLGTRILPVKYVILHGYTDFYRFPWITYTTAGPSTGHDVFAQADVTIPEKLSFYLRYKNEVKEQKFTVEERYVNLPERVQKTRVHGQFHPSDNLTLKTRFEHVFYQGVKKEHGFMVFQDLQVNPERIPVSLSARVAWFSTKSYNSRIYAYENDILYAFSIPAYFGKGLRTYLNLKYRINRRLDFWMKLSNMYRSDTETMGSGYDEIEGRCKTELKFQLRLKI